MTPAVLPLRGFIYEYEFLCRNFRSLLIIIPKVKTPSYESVFAYIIIPLQGDNP